MDAEPLCLGLTDIAFLADFTAAVAAVSSFGRLPYSSLLTDPLNRVVVVARLGEARGEFFALLFSPPLRTRHKHTKMLVPSQKQSLF